MNKYMKLIAILSLSLSVGACSDDSDPQDAPDAGDTGSAMSTLSYTDLALPNLGADYVYEGWLIIGGVPKTAGRFTVNDAGVASPASFELLTEDTDAAPTFVLTIEPAVGDLPAAADTHILAGPIAAGASTLTTDHPASLDTDFAAAAGSFVLTTPTTGDMTVPEQGIWFLVPGMPLTAGLDLPVLPAGWAYEGWVVGANGPVSTGLFTDTAAADSDLAGATAGPVGSGPPFPGQDFITPAVVLNDGATMAVISVEPDPDNSPMPFLIKPLVHTIAADTAPTSQTMTNNAANTLPAASISITAN